MLLLAGACCATGAVASTYAAWGSRRWRGGLLVLATLLIAASISLGAVPWGIGRSAMLVALLVSIIAALALVILSTRKPPLLLKVRYGSEAERSSRRKLAARWTLAGPIALIVAMAWSMPLLLWAQIDPAYRVALVLLAIPVGWAVAATWLLATSRVGRRAAMLMATAVLAIAGSAGMLVA